MIPDLREKCKARLGRVPRDVLIFVVLALVAFASFGLGYLTGEGAAAHRAVGISVAPDIATSSAGAVVASRYGATYYLPWCAGAVRIRAANQRWFRTESEARARGYAPARNCDGL